MFIDLLLILLSVAVLFLSAEGVVRGSTRLARALGIRPLVVGLTVVALGTSAPEMVVTLIAAQRGQIALGLGNIVGSNIANIALIIGLAALVRPLPARPILLRRDLPILTLTMTAYFGMAWFGAIQRWQAAILLAGIVGFCTLLTRQAIRDSRSNSAGKDRPIGSLAAGNGLLLLAGLGGLIVAGHFLVQSSTRLARQFGISETVIGLTLVAFGTSVPEIATSIVAVLRGQPDIALGNVVGSNIFNVLLVQGAAALFFQPFGVDRDLLQLEFPLMVALSVLLFLMLRIRPRIYRWQGILLLLVYLLFLVAQVRSG